MSCSLVKMIALSPSGNSDLLSGSELIRHTLNIHNEGNTSQDPLGRGVLGSLHLCGEDVCVHTIFSLVDGALIDVLLFACNTLEESLGSDDGHDRELNLG